MKTTVGEFNGELVSIAFSPETPTEQRVMTELRSNALSQSAQLTLNHWVESALKSRGYHDYSLLRIVDFRNGYYVFKVGRSRGIGV